MLKEIARNKMEFKLSKQIQKIIRIRKSVKIISRDTEKESISRCKLK